MDMPTAISLIAILVGLGCLGVTLWASILSKRSLNHAIAIQEKGEEKEFQRLRTELLMQIADSRMVLDKTRIEVGTLKADFDAEPQAVQQMMRNYINLFTDYLPRVEFSIQQLDILWKDVSAWPKDKSHHELMDAKAVLYRSIKDDEVVYDSAMFMVSEFRAQLSVARQQILLK